MNVEGIIKGYNKASSFKDVLYRIRAHITAFAIAMIMKISYPNNSTYLPDMGTRMRRDTNEITIKGDFK